MRCSRRLPLLVALAALAACGTGPASAADASPAVQLTITSSDGVAGQPFALAGLAGHEDVHKVRYPLRAADGNTSDVTVAAGFSLGLLLRQAGVDLDGVTYLELRRTDGTSVLVLREQVVNTGGGTPPPVVWIDVQGLHFLRPSAGDDDVNADDLVTPPDGMLAVQLRRGQPFAVRIEPSAQRVRANEPVRFEVVLVAGARTADMDFDWYFADGSATGRGMRVTHRFLRRGSYPVQVNVVKSGSTLEAHDIQVVRVRAPVRHPIGAVGGAGDGGTGGTGSGTGTGDLGAGGGTGTGTGAASGGYGAGVTTYSGSGSTATGGSPPAPSYRSHPPRRTRPPASSTFPASQGELVSGTLLASADAVPLLAGASGSSGHVRGATENKPLHVPAGAWFAALLAVLLAVGWTLESRHIPPFWQP